MTTSTKATASNATPETKAEQKEWIIGARKVNDNTKLKYAANPKRKNSKAWARYESYQKAKTFAQYQELNQDKQSIPDLKYDLSKGFVEIDS